MITQKQKINTGLKLGLVQLRVKELKRIEKALEANVEMCYGPVFSMNKNLC